MSRQPMQAEMVKSAQTGQTQWLATVRNRSVLGSSYEIYCYYYKYLYAT
jgi:hypothetical protein